MDRTVTGSDRRLMVGVMAACAALGGLAGAAAGQSRVVEVRPAAPAPPAPPVAATPSAPSMHLLEIHKDEDGATFVLRMKDGDLSVKANGLTVPAERIERNDGSVTVFDGEGNELTTFELPKGTNVAGMFGEDGSFKFYNAAAGRMALQPSERPRVMVGITMVEVSELLREHLGLEEGQATMVEQVIEGLPADRAGLQRGDVIVAIEGKTPATPEQLRETLRGKEPGEQIEVRVVQKGKEKTVRLKLDKYDAQELNTVMPMARAGVLAGEEARRALEERLGAISVEREKLRSRGQGEGRRELEALRMQEEALRRMLEQPRGGEGVPAAPEPPMVFTPREFGGWAASRQGAPGDVQKRMKELDERLAGLDERLSDLDEKLSRIEKALGRLGDGGSR